MLGHCPDASAVGAWLRRSVDCGHPLNVWGGELAPAIRAMKLCESSKHIFLFLVKCVKGGDNRYVAQPTDSQRVVERAVLACNTGRLSL